MDERLGFGIDIGGSGIKGAPVELTGGRLAAERLRVPTPQPSTPDAVVAVIREVLDHFRWDDAFGCTFPSVVRGGVVETATNVDPSWVGTDLVRVIGTVTGRRAVVLNDADAAGLAEMRVGAGKNRDGVVLVTTLGTGIGSALFLDGKLVPNLQLGLLELDGRVAERHAAASARERENLSWSEWGQRLDRYYGHLDRHFNPDYHIVGGGVSRKADKWMHLVHTRAPMVPAAMGNDAGIIGAAMYAAEHLGKGDVG